MASTPRSQRLPCAARPNVVTSAHDESEVRGHDREARWLGDDRRVGSHAGRDERSCADALELLVHDGRDHDLSLELVGRAHRGGAHGGHPRLHVRRSASIDAPLALKRVPRRVRHAVHADDVEVPVEHQRSPTGASGARDDVRTLRGSVLQIDAQSPLLEHRGQRFRHGVLARAAGDERRIP